MSGASVALPVPYVGKHVERKHVEEFFQFHREPDEVVIAIVDGIIFDEAGRRVGGMTLHDYVILTDQCVILWARGLQSDVLDRLTYPGVAFDGKPIDKLHGEVRLALTPPAVARPVQARIDLLPLNDLASLKDLFDLAKALAGKRSANQPETGEWDRIRKIVEVSAGQRPGAPVNPSPSPTRRPDPAVPAPREAGPTMRRGDPSADAPFGGRQFADQSYSLYRFAQLAKDAVGTLPADLGKTIGLDETLSKLVDRLPRIENLNQITDLINALTHLLQTVSDNPMARAFILQAVDRMVEQGSPIKTLLNFAKNGMNPQAGASPAAPKSEATTDKSETPAQPAAAPASAVAQRRQSVRVAFGSGPVTKAEVPADPKPAVEVVEKVEKKADPLSLDYKPVVKDPELETVSA